MRKASSRRLGWPHTPRQRKAIATYKSTTLRKSANASARTNVLFFIDISQLVDKIAGEEELHCLRTYRTSSGLVHPGRRTSTGFTQYRFPLMQAKQETTSLRRMLMGLGTPSTSGRRGTLGRDFMITTRDSAFSPMELRIFTSTQLLQARGRDWPRKETCWRLVGLPVTTRGSRPLTPTSS